MFSQTCDNNLCHIPRSAREGTRVALHTSDLVSWGRRRRRQWRAGPWHLAFHARPVFVNKLCAPGGLCRVSARGPCRQLGCVPPAGAEQDLPRHAAARCGAHLPRVQRGGHRGAAARQRRPQQRLPAIREVGPAPPPRACAPSAWGFPKPRLQRVQTGGGKCWWEVPCAPPHLPTCPGELPLALLEASCEERMGVR